MKTNTKPILVIGGGIAGMTAAIEAAEVGYSVILVEKEAYLGGRVIRTFRYFPKMCPPTCGYEINVRRIRQNPRIKVFTLATVEEISGEANDFKVKIKVNPRYVKDKHSITEEIVGQLESERENNFNLGMDKTKALYLPNDSVYPNMYVLDKDALSEDDTTKLKQIAPDAIDFDMEPRVKKLDVGSIIVATGWKPYDASKLDNLGFSKYPNVITNVMMERLASRSGPTGGEILRPSDGKPAQNVAFVQCAGSRDETHLPYCSAVCCMASLKQARFLREKNDEAKATMFYIDVRTIGRLEKFYYDMLEDENFSTFKGKVASIEEDEGNNLILNVEDTLEGKTHHDTFDLVVLATGMVPNTLNDKIPFDIHYDDYGFIKQNGTEGIFSAGVVNHPCDVARSTKESTSAALKAIQCLNREE